MIDYNSLSLPDKYTYREEILDPLNRLLQVYIEKHSKILVVRFDIHFPINYTKEHSNSYISETIACVVKKYKRQNLDPMYFWVMEQHQSIHPHYHVVLFLDGQKVCSYGHVFNTVKKAWAHALGQDVIGCIHHCNITNNKLDMQRNGLQIRRCDGAENMQAQVQRVVNQISYLAKENTKAHENDGLRNFGMSRLPK